MARYGKPCTHWVHTSRIIANPLWSILTNRMHVEAPMVPERLRRHPSRKISSSDSQSEWFMIQSELRSLGVCCKVWVFIFQPDICSWKCHMRQIDRSSPCWRGATGTKAGRHISDMEYIIDYNSMMFKHGQFMSVCSKYIEHIWASYCIILHPNHGGFQVPQLPGIVVPRPQVPSAKGGTSRAQKAIRSVSPTWPLMHPLGSMGLRMGYEYPWENGAPQNSNGLLTISFLGNYHFGVCGMPQSDELGL